LQKGPPGTIAELFPLRIEWRRAEVLEQRKLEASKKRDKLTGISP
jgi:hypothetical protein